MTFELFYPLNSAVKNRQIFNFNGVCGVNSRHVSILVAKLISDHTPAILDNSCVSAGRIFFRFGSDKDSSLPSSSLICLSFAV